MLQKRGNQYENSGGTYTRMYQTYSAAMSAVDARRRALRSELKRCVQQKTGDRQSIYTQYRLERRIALLTAEHSELAEAMRSIAVYANDERGTLI